MTALRVDVIDGLLWRCASLVVGTAKVIAVVAVVKGNSGLKFGTLDRGSVVGVSQFTLYAVVVVGGLVIVSGIVVVIGGGVVAGRAAEVVVFSVIVILDLAINMAHNCGAAVARDQKESSQSSHPHILARRSQRCS